MGGCHSNLNRQTRNEFHHQRLASIKLSLTVGKAPQWEVASPCSWELLLPTVPIQHQLPPSQWTQRHGMSDGMAKQKPGGGTASVAPREGMKSHWKEGSAKASHKTESQIHHKWSSSLCLPRGSNIDLYKEMVQSPTFIPRAQSHFGVYTVSKISTSQ